jgi:nucleotide-binding universal stress UspA family protein
MPFKSILCPTDLSPMSVEALRKAVELARTFDAKLTLLHIHEYLMDEKEMIMLRVSVTDYKEVRNKRLAEIEREMAAEITEAGGGDLDVDYLKREGTRPYKEIFLTIRVPE